MAEASLQDRLRAHSEAFNGLLSLIPAKMYYGEDNSNQWNKKKQTKEEAAAARRGKLDPDSELNRNAKEVMDERAKNKRKLLDIELEEEDGAAEEYEAVDGVESEKPGEGLKKKAPESNKKPKLDDVEAETPTDGDRALRISKKEEKRAAKLEKRKEKLAEKQAKRESRESRPDDETTQIDEAPARISNPKKHDRKKAVGNSHDSDPQLDGNEPGQGEQLQSNGTQDGQPQPLDLSGLQDDADNGDETSPPPSGPQSPIFDTMEPSAIANGTSTELASTTTSVSSTIPPSEKPKHIKIPADTSALRARLAAKIEALRAARKADGPDGKPIRTRQELIEARRVKQAQRKAHKKELRQKAKLDELKQREEALASNSPGMMSPAVEVDESNFTFGRVAFGDGAQLSHDLSYVLNQGKKKGPSDPKTALLKVQHQKQRLEELDDEKRKDIAEKEAWLTARRRAQGEKIHDDEAALKRAVKRKDATKKKSEKQWKERARGVEHAQKERQKKREENLKKRRDDKMLGKAGKKKKKPAGAGGKKKGGRPGFEGSLGVGGRRK